MAAKARVLIVEDEGIIARDLKGVLGSLGYDIAGIASSGEEALRRASESGADIVLMDIALPGGMDGVEAAGLIRERFGLPVVFLTAYQDDETLGRALKTGPFAYLTKPFRETELRLALELALYKHSMEREREELIAELRDALASIKTLTGLLPICAWCKKVRDDRGYWTQVETYVQEHSDAQFTHGICPECAKRMERELEDDPDDEK